MEVTAHLENLCPPFMKQHHSPDKPKGHGELWQQRRAVECDLFSLTLSDLPSFLSFICVFVPLQLCSYDVLCASVDVKPWKPVHANLLTLFSVDFVVLLTWLKKKTKKTVKGFSNQVERILLYHNF